MLNVLLIGCGNIAGGFDARRGTGQYTHAGAYLAHGGYRLLACVEPDESRRTAFQQTWAVEAAYASIEEVLQNTREAAPGSERSFDVISICSPTACHADHLRAALELAPGLVFCEKPLTHSLAASREIAALYRDAGLPLLVNYTRRWDPRVRALKRQLEQGEWGRIRSASGVYNKGLYNNGSHLLDLLTLLLGSMSVISAGAPIVDMWADDASRPTMLLAAGDVPVTLNCGHAADYALFELELITERGVIRMENGGLNWRIRRPDASPVFPGYLIPGPPEHQSGTLDSAMVAAMHEIPAVLAGLCLPSCSAEEAVAVQALCESVCAAGPIEQEPT